ncbi:hypothetical protein SBRCBS47491_000927 [Sporothrix bragantina]|uniref:Extracellular serine-rich protein n=1 Tax=Sporothrix bragantina TaxID=671064 RepID=A0ABP0AUD0_9PEZI
MAGLVHGDPVIDGNKADTHAARATTANTPTTLLTAPTTTTPPQASNALSAAPSTIPTHTIAVGATGFTFSPNNLSNVAVGSIIEFNFYPGNHSVVRSAYKFPCIPYEDTGPNRVGFFSGFLDTNVYSSDGPKYRVRVNDTDPIFYYCAAPGSCITQGMIGVINPNSTWTLENQEEYVANTTIQLTPGDPLPSEIAPTTVGGSGATATGSSGSSSSGLSAGAIAGIVIGSLVGIITLIGLGVLLFCCQRRSPRWQARQHRRMRNASTGAVAGSMAGAGDGLGMGPGHASMMSALSPSGRNATPGGHDTTDMNSYLTQVDYRHRTPPLPPVPPHANPYNPATSPPGGHLQFHRPYYGQSSQSQQQQQYVNLPIYNSMATMSPLQSHPTTMGMPGGMPAVYAAPPAVPSPFTDKDYYRTPPLSTPTPPHPQQSPHQQQHQQYAQHHPPAPVELPGAATPILPPSTTPTASPPHGLRPPPPAPTMPRVESPTMGGIDRTWGKEEEATELTQL